MKPLEKLKKEHGSIEAGLIFYRDQGFIQTEIAEAMECNRSTIYQYAKKYGIIFNSRPAHDPRTTEKRARTNAVKQKDSDVSGLTSPVERKEFTVAMDAVFLESRERLSAQVKVIKQGDPEFDAVAADIFRQRQLCQRVDPETVEKMI